jgi:hypothetical protein
MYIHTHIHITTTAQQYQYLPYGIAVDTAKAVDTAIALQFYFMSTAKMQ